MQYMVFESVVVLITTLPGTWYLVCITVYYYVLLPGYVLLCPPAIETRDTRLDFVAEVASSFLLWAWFFFLFLLHLVDKDFSSNAWCDTHVFPSGMKILSGFWTWKFFGFFLRFSSSTSTSRLRHTLFFSGMRMLSVSIG